MLWSSYKGTSDTAYLIKLNKNLEIFNGLKLILTSHTKVEFTVFTLYLGIMNSFHG